jgi:uncharacterized protein YnzC (UPF0291/DUF896 family)
MHIDGLHVVAYYELWSVNEVDKKNKCLFLEQQEIHQQIMRQNVLLHVKTTVTPICHCDLLGY